VHEHDFDAYLDFEDQSERSAPRKRRRARPRIDDELQPTRSGRLTEAERERLARVRDDAEAAPELPPGAARWSTWDGAEHGPRPRPDWVITALAAADTELGILKTGKEADVYLLERAIPGQPGCLLAAKRYRAGEHRMFHRDAGYLEGRRMRRSREMRAIANRTSFGRNLIAEQWAVAEFTALSRLWTIGAPVPYPVQREGTELLMEYLGNRDGDAAPRLAQQRPEPDELVALWHQLTAALELLAIEGLTHGDLSAFNVLVQDGQLMLIDLPQVVDVVANPRGVEYLRRDVRNITEWFVARGLPADLADQEQLVEELLAAAGAR
jgi:RIO kinase 1